MHPPLIHTLPTSITDDPRPPVEQLEALLSDPQSERLRRRFFGVLAGIQTPADVAPWIRAARELYDRGAIDDHGWVYFAAMFLECITHGDGVVDSELTRIQGEIDAFERSYEASDDDDGDVDDTPEMVALFAAYDARARKVEVACLRELGFTDLADDVERDYDAFLDRSEVGAAKLFDEETWRG